MTPKAPLALLLLTTVTLAGCNWPPGSAPVSDVCDGLSAAEQELLARCNGGTGPTCDLADPAAMCAEPPCSRTPGCLVPVQDDPCEVLEDSERQTTPGCVDCDAEPDAPACADPCSLDPDLPECPGCEELGDCPEACDLLDRAIAEAGPGDLADLQESLDDASTCSLDDDRCDLLKGSGFTASSCEPCPRIPSNNIVVVGPANAFRCTDPGTDACYRDAQLHWTLPCVPVAATSCFRNAIADTGHTLHARHLLPVTLLDQMQSWVHIGGKWSDLDQDGLANLLEVRLAARGHNALDPCNPDSDGDGVEDGHDLTQGNHQPEIQLWVTSYRQHTTDECSDFHGSETDVADYSNGATADPLALGPNADGEPYFAVATVGTGSDVDGVPVWVESFTLDDHWEDHECMHQLHAKVRSAVTEQQTHNTQDWEWLRLPQDASSWGRAGTWNWPAASFHGLLMDHDGNAHENGCDDLYYNGFPESCQRPTLDTWGNGGAVVSLVFPLFGPEGDAVDGAYVTRPLHGWLDAQGNPPQQCMPNPFGGDPWCSEGTVCPSLHGIEMCFGLKFTLEANEPVDWCDLQVATSRLNWIVFDPTDETIGPCRLVG